MAVSVTSSPQSTVAVPLTVPRDVSFDRPVTVQRIAPKPTTTVTLGVAPLVVTVQVVPVPLQPPPFQDVIWLLAVGLAVSVTVSPHLTVAPPLTVPRLPSIGMWRGVTVQSLRSKVAVAVTFGASPLVVTVQVSLSLLTLVQPLHDLTWASVMGSAVSETSSPQSTVAPPLTVPRLPSAGAEAPVTVQLSLLNVAVAVTSRSVMLVVTVQVALSSLTLVQPLQDSTLVPLVGCAVSSTSSPQVTVALPLTVPRDVSFDTPVTVQSSSVTVILAKDEVPRS